MKIKSLHIQAFGGIKNLDLNLDNHFNIIYGGNENGKTTIMSFIKMMFYGTERSGAQLNKNLRKKYTPWDNSIMAGSIDFESEGRLYRLERIFGNSNSTDKVTLIDLGLGTAKPVSSDIGIKLFGLSAAAFERSIFIGQFGFPESNNLASGELNGKLSNIALTGDETISFDAVNQRLENAKYELMSKSGRSGIYDKNLKLCDTLEKELLSCEEAQKTIQNAKLRAQQITEEIKAMQEKALALKSQIDSENDLRNAKKLQELLDLKARLDELNQSLTLNDGSLADEMFVRKLEFCLSKIESIENKISAKQTENENLENNLRLAASPAQNATPEALSELTEKIDSLNNQKENVSLNIKELEETPKFKIKPVWFVLLIIIAAAAAGLLLLKPTYYIYALCLIAVAVATGVINILSVKKANRNNQSKLMELKLQETKLISLITAENSNLTAIKIALNSNSAMIENQKELIAKCKEEIKSLIAERDNEKEILFGLFGCFEATKDIEKIKAALSEIKKTAASQKELKQNINYILKDVGNISYEQAKEKLANLNPGASIDFDAVKNDYEQLLQQITENKTAVTAILTEAKSISANSKKPSEIKKELEALKQKTAAQKEYCDCLDIALSVLADSYAQVRRSYGSALEKKAGSIFKGLTDGAYENMSISKSFEIMVEKKDVFGIKELDYLSSGTVDQAYLSLRLALSELLSQDNNGLPIILDDALAQYDDSRTQTALKFLKEYSQNGQIIMFTCHKSVVDTAKQFEVNQIEL